MRHAALEKHADLNTSLANGEITLEVKKGLIIVMKRNYDFSIQ